MVIAEGPIDGLVGGRREVVGGKDGLLASELVEFLAEVLSLLGSYLCSLLRQRGPKCS